MCILFLVWGDTTGSKELMRSYYGSKNMKVGGHWSNSIDAGT